MLETKILSYLNYLGDSEYMLEVVTTSGAVDTLIKLLQSGDKEIVGYTCLFITDFVLSRSCNETNKQLWDGNLELAIVPELERLVFADNFFIRKQVIYTLGKICSYESLPVLLRAFHQLRDRDPILLPRLVGELFWLGSNNRFDIITSMAASHRYTTRWSALAALQEFLYDLQPQDETCLMRYKFSDHLRHDSHLLVKAEAEYEYQVLELNRRKYQENLSKSEYRRQKKELKKLKPSLSFSNICNLFSNYMYTHDLSTYTVEELENFIERLMYKY
ncbi:hypothetical protein NUACC21_45500 [Scytonema sp. NUACC21]